MTGDLRRSGHLGALQSTAPGVAPEYRAGFRVTIGRALGNVIVSVHGRLDGATAQVLGDNLSDLIRGQGNLFLVVDLQDVVVADSGLDVLVTAKRSVDERNGRLLLERPSQETAAALRAVGLGGAISVHPERRHHPTAGNGSLEAESQQQRSEGGRAASN